MSQYQGYGSGLPQPSLPTELSGFRPPLPYLNAVNPNMAPPNQQNPVAWGSQIYGSIPHYPVPNMYLANHSFPSPDTAVPPPNFFTSQPPMYNAMPQLAQYGTMPPLANGQAPHLYQQPNNGVHYQQAFKAPTPVVGDSKRGEDHSSRRPSRTNNQYEDEKYRSHSRSSSSYDAQEKYKSRDRDRRVSDERYSRRSESRHSSRSCSSRRSRTPEKRTSSARSDRHRTTPRRSSTISDRPARPRTSPAKTTTTTTSIDKGSEVPKQTEQTRKKKRKKKAQRDDRYEKLRPKWYDGDGSETGSETDDSEPALNFEETLGAYSRSSPADLYYCRDSKNPIVITALEKTKSLCANFEEQLLERGRTARQHNDEKNTQAGVKKCPVAAANGCHKHKHSCSSSDSDSDDSTIGSSDDDWVVKGADVMDSKQKHPDRLHPELWYNEQGEMNDGPLCRCSAKSRKSGIRHGFHAGEQAIALCDPWTNNADRLYHYVVTISPPTNFLIKVPTIIPHDSHEFIFEGFSLFSHYELSELPTCQVIRFNIEYSILYLKDKMPENFCIQELNVFNDFLYTEVLEMLDLNLKAGDDANGCPRFHFMPRFVRSLADNGKEILSMSEVLKYLLKSSVPLVDPKEMPSLMDLSEYNWLNHTDIVKGMIATYPGKKPCSIRVDQIDREPVKQNADNFPVIVHFGIRPPQLSYAGNPEYQKALKAYVKFRHLLANMPKPSEVDKRNLETKEAKLQEMRMGTKMKKDVTVAVSSAGFWRTGLMCDVVQHALLMPVMVRHLRFHRSLDVLEKRIEYKFKTRYLLQLALTHPSYRENFGTNPDHARNSLTNCGIRQPEYGDRRIHYVNSHKRGINTLINIMSRFGHKKESDSKICNNERLEFLGDSVVEFLSSIHLFHLFPNLEEGGLATYRAAIVQNQQLSVLAEKLRLEDFVLHAHGSDLCHSYELKHAMANCFEALMGAIFIDSGISEADLVFSKTLFFEEEELFQIWMNYKPHPLQEQEPQGDRKWINTYPNLQKLTAFEKQIGIEFRHIRILARAFTDRSIGFNYLTLGSNQRLEFLGDTVLQLVSSEYLFRFFPEHHEGHLSLLRSSLVNNRTQSVVCVDLGMPVYAMHSHFKSELKTKDKADLLEAFLGALYIDRGLDFCRVFCSVCFFPRLQHFIINQNWNDPKSKLQQCCLTLRTMEGGEPDIPMYKVIECTGPTNTRVYTVAVYFRNERLAKSSGHSIQQAEMNAAKNALELHKELFPHLNYQRRIIERNVKVKVPAFGGDPCNQSEGPRPRRDERPRDRSRDTSRTSSRAPSRPSSRARSPDRYDRKRRRSPSRN